MTARTKQLAIALALLLLPATLWSYPPLVVVVAGAEVTTAGGSAETAIPVLSSGVDLDWRAPAGDAGYAALWAEVRFETEPAGGWPVADSETLGMEIGGFIGDLDVAGSAAIMASTGLLDSAARIEPSWHFSGLLPLAERPIDLGVAVSGNYRWQESESVDRLENRLSIRLVSEPSFMASYRYDITGGLDYFPGSYLPDTDGAPTAVERRDVVGVAEARLDILNHFTRWSANLQFGGRFSNAARYVAADGSFEPASENRVFGSVAADLAASPTGSLAISLSLTADTAYYAGRAALDGAGEPVGQNLAYLRSTAGITAAWSPAGSLYLVGRLSGAGALSNDPSYAGWSAAAGLTVEWRL